MDAFSSLVFFLSFPSLQSNLIKCLVRFLQHCVECRTSDESFIDHAWRSPCGTFTTLTPFTFFCRVFLSPSLLSSPFDLHSPSVSQGSYTLAPIPRAVFSTSLPLLILVIAADLTKDKVTEEFPFYVFAHLRDRLLWPTTWCLHAHKKGLPDSPRQIIFCKQKDLLHLLVDFLLSSLLGSDCNPAKTTSIRFRSKSAVPAVGLLCLTLPCASPQVGRPAGGTPGAPRTVG